jgi:hypothetical protein
MQINEAISVSTGISHAPIAFVWRGASYAVIAEPEIWFEKTPWWRVQSSPGQPLSTPERRVYRVSALPCSGPRSLHSKAPDEGIYDLTRTSDGGWILTEAHTDSIDVQLFA